MREFVWYSWRVNWSLRLRWWWPHGSWLCPRGYQASEATTKPLLQGKLASFSESGTQSPSYMAFASKPQGGQFDSIYALNWRAHSDSWNSMECSQRLLQVVCTLSHTIWNLDQVWPHVGCHQNLWRFGVGNTFAICCKLWISEHNCQNIFDEICSDSGHGRNALSPLLTHQPQLTGDIISSTQHTTSCHTFLSVS